jgi:prepilin signal peptidase PulO-like enzyme (type II secretory pathway)
MAYILGAIFFAIAAYVGVLLAGLLHIEKLPDGPPTGEPRIPLLIAAAALLGAAVTAHASNPLQLVLVAMLCVALTAIWCTDVRYGIVPDVFTLIPLAIVFAVGAVRHEWLIFGSAAVPFIAFAAAAWLSRGRGMGWGDVKLATLGGAVLGLEASLVAFSLSCLAAAMYAYARGQKDVPIAFAPYLVAAIAIALPAATLL